MTSVASLRVVAFAVIALFGAMWAVGEDDGKAQPAPAAPPATSPIDLSSDVELMTWEGFLWVSAEGWTRMGAPLVSGPFQEGTPRVVDRPLSDRMRSIQGAIPSFIGSPVFWFGSELARDDWEPQRRGEPRFLLKLRGQAEPTIAHLSLDEERPLFGAYGRPPSLRSPVSLRNARLVSIERLDSKWLAAWRTILRAELSLSVAAGGDARPSEEVRTTSLKAEIDALGVMRAVTPSDDDLLIAARKIDPDVWISTKFRHRVENVIQKRVAREATVLGVALPTTLVGWLLPPESEASRWFADARTRASFLARAALAWKGAPEDFVVAHSEDDGEGRSWLQLADLETIRNGWSDARYESIRETILIGLENAAPK